MATPYVKFSRGTPLAYQKLSVKNNDTLYFITDETTNKSWLYLGSDLISGEISTLSDLQDLVISAVADKQLLVYDETTAKWVNKSVADAIGVYQGATVEQPGIAGLVPAAAAGQEDYFLAGDGTWKQVKSDAPVSPTQVFEATIQDEESAEEAIVRVVGATGLNKGDIGVAKKLISGDKYEYTAFVYNGSAWAAMDGNYSAENVYFNSDFVFTEKVGTVTIPSSGSTTVTATGKNVKEFLAGLFAAPKNPAVTQPSVSITLSGAGAKEVGSTVTPSYSVSFNAGSYTYGPATGITPTYTITNTADSDTKDTATGSFSAITVGDSTSYSVSVKAEYGAGAVPKNNLGSEVPELAILAGSKSATSSGKYTGYRNCFYGTLTEKAEELTSADIRGLTATNKAVAKGSTVALNIAGGTGVMRIVFAYPATLGDITEVIDKNDSNANIVGAFSQKLGQIDVEGANGYEAIPYKVWIQDLGSAYADNNTYTFKIG